MRHKLTVIIPTYNEEKNIEDAIKSVLWADEIMIVDSYSTDRTLEIARKYTDRILQHEYINSATQKNWAIPQATHEWVMILDADERVTPELRDEILKVLENPQFDGYYIGRRNFFLGYPLDHGGWSPKDDRNIRLFRKSVSRYEDKEVHADVIVSTGRVGELKNYLIHHSYISLKQYFRKMERYTDWAARDIVKAGKKPNFLNLVLRPIGDFIKFYILKQGYKDGMPGLIIALLSSYYVMVKYAKAWELYHSRA